jgi:Lon protease-like protein
MAEHATLNFNRPLPVFPLNACVLLPHATVPLHIFEDRYKHMTRDALDSHGVIAMATYAGQAHSCAEPAEESVFGPPIREHVCVGYILRHQQLEEGRYNILLQGVCRARIRKEVYHEPYRLAFLEPTEADPPMEIDISEQRSRLEALLGDDRLKQLASINSINNWLSREIPTPALVDLATLTVCCDLDQRYAMLAEPDVTRRLTWLDHHLRQTRHTLELAARHESGPTDEGCHIN